MENLNENIIPELWNVYRKMGVRGEHIWYKGAGEIKFYNEFINLRVRKWSSKNLFYAISTLFFFKDSVVLVSFSFHSIAGEGKKAKRNKKS